MSDLAKLSTAWDAAKAQRDRARAETIAARADLDLLAEGDEEMGRARPGEMDRARKRFDDAIEAERFAEMDYDEAGKAHDDALELQADKPDPSIEDGDRLAHERAHAPEVTRW